MLYPPLYILSPPLVLFCCLNPSIFPLALHITETTGNTPFTPALQICLPLCTSLSLLHLLLTPSFPPSFSPASLALPVAFKWPHSPSPRLRLLPGSADSPPSRGWHQTVLGQGRRRWRWTEGEEDWGCCGWTVVGVAALWVVCFLRGWDTMPPVFRQAHRSLFYNRGGAAINGQMM